MTISNKAWFSKYQPKELKDLVFDNEEHQQLVTKWMTNGKIDGNILFYGPPGLGKTATSEILINSIIQAKNDLYITSNRTIAEIREQIKPFLTKKPIKSKNKIVYIEEVDKISNDGINELKNGLMEKYLEYNSFICCTNHIRKLEAAFLTRFTYKISFSGSNVSGIILRLKDILQQENCEFEESNLVEFVEKNYKVGIRELINSLQLSSVANNNKIDFNNIQGFSGLEESIVILIRKILKEFMTLKINEKRTALKTPINTSLGNDWNDLVVTLHNNYDINYNNVFDRLLENNLFVPLQLIIAKHSENNEFKKYPHLNVISCIHEMLKCLYDIN